MATRNGKPLAVLPDGDRRRMSDGKNAWRKMTHTQQCEYLGWILCMAPETASNMLSYVCDGGNFCMFVSDEEEEE